jgi:quinol monooxygenase YgiN
MFLMRRILPLVMVAAVILWLGASVDAAGPPQQASQKSPAPLYVATFVDLMPANKEAGTKAIRDYVVATRQEPGVIRIEAIAQVGGRDNHLVVFEVWKDLAAFDQHEAAANTRDFRTKLAPLIGAPFDQRLHFLVQ